MQFYNATTKDAICQEIDRLCDTSDTEYSRLDKTSRVNRSQEVVGTWIRGADGFWQFDDSNYTDLPIGVGTLVSGQLSYTFASDFLDILEVDILGTSGVYQRVTPFDPDELGMSFEEWRNHTTSTTQSGFPRFYDKVGDTIKFDVAPTATHVTLANGVKVRFKRTTKDFTATSATSSDTTEPGFASPFHIILAYMAARPYCAQYKPERLNFIDREVGRMKEDMVGWYSRREKDKRSIMTPNRRMFGTNTIGL